MKFVKKHKLKNMDEIVNFRSDSLGNAKPIFKILRLKVVSKKYEVMVFIYKIKRLIKGVSSDSALCYLLGKFL